MGLGLGVGLGLGLGFVEAHRPGARTRDAALRTQVGVHHADVGHTGQRLSVAPPGLGVGDRGRGRVWVWGKGLGLGVGVGVGVRVGGRVGVRLRGERREAGSTHALRPLSAEQTDSWATAW